VNLYTFKASNGTTVSARRGELPPKMTGGGGGWEVEPRPRRVGLTLWKGREPYRMDVPILFDGHALGKSVEQSIAKLNQMHIGSDLKQPPTVMIEGGVPVKGIRWVIENIEWGDHVYWVKGGQGPFRTRQDAVVKLLQYNPEVRVSVRRDSTTRPNRYVTKAGDTLRSIAKSLYDDAMKWQSIATANNLRIPGTQKLTAGKTLRIP